MFETVFFTEVMFSSWQRQGPGHVWADRVTAEKDLFMDIEVCRSREVFSN